MQTIDSASGQLKTPYLDLIQAGPETSVLALVSDDGMIIANLIEFNQGGVHLCEHACNALEACGYDTSFARWDEDGRIEFGSIMKENFDSVFLCPGLFSLEV